MRRTLKLLAQNMGRSAQNLLLQEPAEKMQPQKERLEQNSAKHHWFKLPELFQKEEKQGQEAEKRKQDS